MTDITEIKQRLARDAETIARLLLPNGKKSGNEWRAGNVSGDEGQSLGVHLTGSKAGIWFDFASDKGGDVLDLYQAVKGVTLAEALKWAKEYLGVTEPQFEPQRTKTYRKPERPKNCIVPKNAVLDYLHSRGITDEAIKAFSIGEIPSMEFDYRGQKIQSPAIVFPFKVDDEVLFMKFQGTIRPNKEKPKDKLIMASGGCEPRLFGWQAVPVNARAIVIGEGEINAMSWWLYGIPALATPFGAGKGKKHNWIESEWENLTRFEVIYLDFDPDPAGKEALDDLVGRLGRHRCHIVPTKPVGKDLNDCLQAKVPQEQIQALLEQSKTCDPAELRRASEFKDAVIEQFYPTNQAALGFELPFDAMRGKFNLRPGECTIWTGFSKHGKTQVLNYVHAMVAASGERVCTASFEMRAPVLLKRQVRQITAQREPSREYIGQIMDWMNDKLWIFDHVGSAKKDRILEVFEYAYRRYGIRYFIVDSLMKCGIAGDDYTAQDTFVDDFTNFANLNDVHVSLVAHTRKDNDEDKPPGGQDVKGSGGMKDRAHNVVITWRNKPKERARESYAQGNSSDKILSLLNEPDAYLIVDCQREGDGETPTQPLWFDKDTQTYRCAEHDPIKPLVPFVQPTQAPIARDPEEWDDRDVPKFGWTS